MNSTDKKEKNVSFDVHYNRFKNPRDVFLKNINFNKTSFSPFVFNLKTPLKKENYIFSDNEAFNFSLSSNLKFSKLSGFLRQSINQFFNQNRSEQTNSFLNVSVFLKEKFIKALYPELDNPSPIKFEAALEDNTNNSYVELDVPFLSTSNYKIKSLSLKVDRNKELLKFEIGSFKNNNFLFKNLKLTTDTDKTKRSF